MRISRVRIEGFRSVESLQLELPQVCAFVGPNNAGKSNILEAINRVLGRDWVTKAAFSEEDVAWHHPDGDINIEVELDPPPAYLPFKHSRPVEVPLLRFTWTRYKVGTRKGERRLEQTPLSAAGTAIQVPRNAPKPGVKPTFVPLTNVPQEVREQIPVIHIGTDRSLARQLPSVRNSLLRRLFDDVLLDFTSASEEVQFIDQAGRERSVPRASRFAELIDEIMSLLRTPAFFDIEQEIKTRALRQLGLAGSSDSLDLEFGPLTPQDFYQALDLVVNERGFRISATELGHGVQNALVLSILQVFERRRKRGAILLIEEPEMFLHPQLQRALYRTIRLIGETNQVLYVTHSPHFVSIPEYDEVVRVTREGRSTEARRSTFARTPEFEEKARKELDPERNELFFATRLLLVEGDTEKLALPEYADRLGLDLDASGASIVEVGGKRNLPAFVEIAKSFAIPTGVLYDTDASDFKDGGEEQKFNAWLDEQPFESHSEVRVWPLVGNYEEHLRRACGEQAYQELCQRHPNRSKPVRARLIAADSSTPIPEPLEEVLSWLAGPASSSQPDSGGKGGEVRPLG
jgi:putative ATP-dependent endonuclease of OLD family